jgi:hypothetical protein
MSRPARAAGKAGRARGGQKVGAIRKRRQRLGKKKTKDGSPSATETFGVWENRPLKPARVYRTRGKFGSPLPTYFARSALI